MANPRSDIMPKCDFDIKLTEKYYKQSRTGRDPIKLHMSQRCPCTDVNLTVTMDPVLKKHPDLKADLIQHEINEAKCWGKGETGCHRKASQQDSKLLKNIGGVTGFWREIAKRKKK